MDANDQSKHDMRTARLASTVNSEALGRFVWNNRIDSLKQIKAILESDPTFNKSRRPFLGRSDSYALGLERMHRLAELRQKYQWSDSDLDTAIHVLDEVLPLNLHVLAFRPVILSQGSNEQIAEVGQLAQKLSVLGAYAQTELGHGSNVAGLETTATYIAESDEFEIHSPTLTSTKWWAGGLGKTATHAVVQAQLILPETGHMGPHLFIVQVRSLDDHRSMKGITLGDIGPKAFGAMAALDNGFARFDHVRIPRAAMLSKFAYVTKEGEYKRPPHSKISYGGMIYIRSSLITGFGVHLAKAATIAIRYCTVRRQGGVYGELERQVITYPTVYIRLVPALAQAYVFILLGRLMNELFESMASRLATSDTSLLAETHAISSGLKSYVTSAAINSVGICRAALGGHGYSAFAGVGQLLGTMTAGMTYEGDNYVLDKQVVRAALKSYHSVSKANSIAKLPPSSQYLEHLRAQDALLCLNEVDWSEPTASVTLLEWRAALAVRKLAQEPENDDAGAQHRVAVAVTEAFIARRVLECMRTWELAGRDAEVLQSLFTLYLMVLVEAALSDILFFDLLSASGPSVDALRSRISRSCEMLLPDLIGLTDAFGFTDWELDSALGKYDGAVYEALWKSAQEEPLNDKDVVDGYQEHLKPLLIRGRRPVAAQHKGKL